MEAPMTSLPATPSNFGAVTQARASAAEGGLYQPSAGAQDTPAGAQGWADGAAVKQRLQQSANVDPSVHEKKLGGESMPRTDEHGAELQQDAQQQRDPNAEQLYDENGEPVDMEAYQAQRAQVLQAIESALDDGKFPIDALKHLPVEVKVNGETREVPLEEALAGYSRRAYMTQQLEKAYGIQAQAEHVLNLERQRNMEWRDPQAMRMGLRMLGLEESVKQMALLIAKEEVDFARLTPSEQQRELQLRQLRAEKEAAIMQARMQQQRQPQGMDPATAHAAKQIEQLMPRAFRAAGVKPYALSQKTFIEQLSILCPDGDITPERALEAAHATREFLEDLARMNAGQGQRPDPNAMRDPVEQPQQPRSAWPLGPRRLAGAARPQLMLGSVMTQGGGGGPVRPGAPAGRRPSDFARRMGLG